MAPELVRRAPSPELKSPERGSSATAIDKKQAAVLSDDSKVHAALGEAARIPRDDEEDSMEMYVKLRRAFDNDEWKTIMEKEKEEGIFENRPKQAVLYFYYAEMRIQQLEVEVQTLKQDLHNLPDEFEVRRRQKLHPVYQHLLQRSSPSQFRMSKSSFDTPREERAALEVLIVEHIERKQQQPGAPLSRRRTGPEGDQVNIHWSPERLRIRSRPLISHLQIVTATQISDSLYVPQKDVKETSTVLLRPFKLLVTYEKEIRQSVDAMEEAVQKRKQQDNPSADVPRAPKKSSDESTCKDSDLLEDLKVLIKFMDEELKPTFDLRQSIDQGTAEVIAYGDLWHLFHRGDLVLLQSDPTHAYKILQFTGGREPLTDRLDEHDDKPKPLEGFNVDCLSVESNGSSYVPKLTTVSILPYLGQVSIKSLAVYPMKFDPRAIAKREEFMEQGRRYLDLTAQPFAHKSVLGKTLDEPSHDLDAQVIIDMTLAIHSNPDWKPSTKINVENLTPFDRRETRIAPYCFHNQFNEGCCGSDHAFNDWEMDQIKLNAFSQENVRLFAGRDAKDLTEEDLMLLPTWVYGFVLRTRRWATIRVADLSEVKFENDFKNLMLPEEYKRTIQALVETHENNHGSSDASGASSGGSVGSGIDLVRGKGTGLILLLHGAPGVGKTSTAECVADTTRRPLFPVTCGDIGETATEVEQHLQHNFRLAHKWGCVLLLDEADVFLARRTRHDIRHNAITSVFLRSLEYYAGILFLTTNRVGHIDPAFRSRINLSLPYHPFDLENTVRLYRTFIERTKTEQKKRGTAHFVINRKEVLAFAKENYRRMYKEKVIAWNGRQIRNAFQAAISLTEHEYQKKLVDGRWPKGKPLPELGRPQLTTVADRSKEFDQYMMETIGQDEADMAQEEQARADRFLHDQRKKAQGAAGLARRNNNSGAAAAAAAAATARKKGKGVVIAPIVTDIEDEDEDEEPSPSEDEEDEEGDEDDTDKEKDDVENTGGNESDDSDSNDVEQMKAIMEMLRKQKMKKKGKK